MKTVNKIAISMVTVFGLSIAVVWAHDQQGQMGGMGPSMMHGGMVQGQMLEQHAHMKIMRELMTPSERLAMMDKMIDAKTYEERQAVMIATSSEMERRAKEKGITLPFSNGHKMMPSRNCG